MDVCQRMVKAFFSFYKLKEIDDLLSLSHHSFSRLYVQMFLESLEVVGAKERYKRFQRSFSQYKNEFRIFHFSENFK